MKHPAMNPYLPLWEYVPDGEPHTGFPVGTQAGQVQSGL